MNRYLRTGIKLSRETRQAWELAGFTVMRSGFMAAPIMEADGLLLNYGSPHPISPSWEGLVLNSPERIHRTRVEELPKYVGEYMPLVQLDGSYIVKANGSKGKGKLVVAEGSPVIVQRFLYPATEYRVVTWDIPLHQRRVVDSAGRVSETTVGMHPEVLAWSLKEKDDPMDPRSGCNWYYQPTYNIPAFLNHTLLVAHIKLGLNFVGWDVLLHEGQWYIIEANSAPGVGFETAKRIRKRLRRVLKPLELQVA